LYSDYPELNEQSRAELAEEFRALAEEFPVEFVTVGGYLRRFGVPERRVMFVEDDWRRLLAWGIGGDQVRVLCRRVEGRLLGLECLEALACLAGGAGVGSERLAAIGAGWRDLLTAQSKDVALLEYIVNYRAAPPAHRGENAWGRSWGLFGFDHALAASRMVGEVQPAVIRELVGMGEGEVESAGQDEVFTFTVFNPCAWSRSGVVTVGGITGPAGVGRVRVCRSDGVVVPSQLRARETDARVLPGADGVGFAGAVVFLASDVPACGYDTYEIAFVVGEAEPSASDLVVDVDGLELASARVRVRLDPVTGCVVEVEDRVGAFAGLGGAGSAIFSGRPNPEYPLRSSVHRVIGPESLLVGEHSYDGAATPAEIELVEQGPARARISVRQTWPFLQLLTVITLDAGADDVEVTTKVAAEAPPANDLPAKPERLYPIERMGGGYWTSFSPAFAVSSILRDYPFGVDETKVEEFPALSFVDLLDDDGAGVLLTHSGTQLFRRAGDRIDNLLMREWESFFLGTYGWPRAAEYTHRLYPHAHDLSNGERLRRATELSMPLIVERLNSPPTRPRHGFLSVEPDQVQLSAFHRINNNEYELRLVEIEGKPATAHIHLDAHITHLAETNLEGTPTNPDTPSKHQNGTITTTLQPWQIKTLRLQTS
jgi:hypothetical protein